MKPFIFIVSAALALVAPNAFSESIGGGAGSTGGSSGAGVSEGTGTGAGPSTGDADGGAGTTTGETGTGEAGSTATEDDSGIFRTEESPLDFERGDSAPRTEPDVRDDRFNTTPRVPAEPADEGGSGATGGTVDDDDPPSGDINAPVPVPDDAGVDATDPTSGDRDLTRERNGTAGSRAPAGRTIR